MQKFYLHDKGYQYGGNLPGATSPSGTTPNVTAPGAAVNRAMDDTIGVSQTSAALTTLAQSSAQDNWFRRFLSPPLAAQTIAASGTWKLDLGASESSTNSSLNVTVYLALWRPSTGTWVADLFSSFAAIVAVSSTVEASGSGTFTNAPVTVAEQGVCTAPA